MNDQVMNKLYLSGVCFLSLSVVSGCDYFDKDESHDYDKQGIFSSYTRAKQMVTNIYSYLPSDFCEVDGAMLDAASDDAVHLYEASELNRISNGTWSANHTVNDVWSRYYEAIRAANLYLSEAPGLLFKDMENTDNYEDMMREFRNYPFEVRFLRAYYYFELLRRYRNVPLILGVLTPAQANAVEPKPFAEVAAFVCRECTEIAEQLPVNYNGFASKEHGRITRGAALALKSRMTLYMASPLFCATGDAEKWKDAARAAYAVMSPESDLGYAIQKGYRNISLQDNYARKDVILCRPVGETGSFEMANFPMGIEGGHATTCPTENLMEAYEMKYPDGKYHAFDWNDPQVRKNPYANRDPRMELTIVHDGQTWLKVPMEIWEGGAHGLPQLNATVTGYYLCKYVNHNISFAAGSKVTKMPHNWVLFSYAEILLNYAEAMVQAFRDPAHTDADFPVSAVEAVNLIRAREDVGMPPVPDNIGADEFLRRLKNERRVELAFEGHRFWDVRRWKELEQTAEIYGMRIRKEASGKLSYTRFLYESRPVQEKMYFFPISNQELCDNTKLEQNPGW